MNPGEFLFVTHKYPPSTGGMQKQSFELITHAAKTRKVHTIIFRSNYPKVFFLLSVAIRTWIKLITHPEIKLIHANDGLMALFLTPFINSKRVKFCATIHGLDVVFNSSVYQFWVKRFLSRSSFLIAVSEATQKECIVRGIPEEKVFYIPNAVELPEKVERDPDYLDWIKENYKVDLEDQFVISSVGRPVPRKGFGWFAKEVLPQLENTKYLVVGTAMEKSWIILTAKKILPVVLFEKICKMLGVPLDNLALSEIARNKKNNLILLGKVPYNKLLQTYIHSDLFVMPNIHVKGDFEGFGLVALEAGSLGTVCLAAEVDGIPSAIQDGENGFLLASRDVDKWVGRIKELQEEANLKKVRKKIRSHFYAEPTTWKQMTEQYLELFDTELKND